MYQETNFPTLRREYRLVGFAFLIGATAIALSLATSASTEWIAIGGIFGFLGLGVAILSCYWWYRTGTRWPVLAGSMLGVTTLAAGAHLMMAGWAELQEAIDRSR